MLIVVRRKLCSSTPLELTASGEEVDSRRTLLTEFQGEEHSLTASVFATRLFDLLLCQLLPALLSTHLLTFEDPGYSCYLLARLYVGAAGGRPRRHLLP